MNLEQLKKALKVTSTVYLSGYKWLTFLRTTTDYEILESVWMNYKRDFSPPPNVNNDSTTFGDCVDCIISLENDQIIMTVEIWDGDNLHGHRTKRRCKHIVHVIKAHEQIVNVVQHELRLLAKYEIEKEEQSRLDKKIAKKMKQLLEEVK